MTRYSGSQFMWLLFIFVLCIFIQISEEHDNRLHFDEWEHEKWVEQSNKQHYSLATKRRDKFFFPFFGVVRFANSQCEGENGLNGTCYSRRECASVGGTAAGTCANGLGCCCVVVKSCGTSTRTNCTYFVNPSYPSIYTDGGRCTITINKCNSDICQLRIDFLDFSLAQPDANGNCVNDFMTVTGSASTVPRICGENTGEHMYVQFASGSSPIEIAISTSSTVAANRRWNLKLTQLACDCPTLAPVGCLMYYTGITGSVKSFNYGTTASTETLGTREMANLNYGVCVRMEEGYCSIQWTQNPDDPYSFTVSMDTGGLDMTVLGTPTAQLTGADCTTDFIVIPNPSQNGVPVNSDRFCGNGLAATTTSSKPFVLTVVTNADETSAMPPDNENRGFCLMYTQLPCTN